MLFKLISRIKKHLWLLYNAGFYMALLGQLTLINGCLLMHSALVRINELKYNFGKQKSIWLVKIFG